MIARNVMTTEVVSVGPDTPTYKIARLLIDHGISAVPVVDGSGAPIGMVSEGDLIGATVPIATPGAIGGWRCLPRANPSLRNSSAN